MLMITTVITYCTTYNSNTSKFKLRSVLVCTSMCVRVSVCACVHVFVCVCVRDLRRPLRNTRNCLDESQAYGSRQGDLR